MSVQTSLPTRFAWCRSRSAGQGPLRIAPLPSCLRNRQPRPSAGASLLYTDIQAQILKGREATVKMKHTIVNRGKGEVRVLCYHYPWCRSRAGLW